METATVESKPSENWSATNQRLMLCAGTEDARGYQQWRKAGRQVRKGSKAIRIFVPRKRKDDTVYFHMACVFAFEDTDPIE